MIFFILLFHPHFLPMEQPLSLCMKTQKGTIYSGLSVLETISDLTSQAQRTADDLCDMTMIPAAAWTSQPILSRHDFDGIPNLGGVASQPSNRGPPSQPSLEYGRFNAPNNPAKRGPKPFGTAPHNLKIKEVADSITDGKIIAGGQRPGLPERLISTPGGFKSGRRPDILVQRPDGSKYGINVGRQSRRTGAPIKREAEAISDLEEFGIEMHFVPYD